MHSRTQPATPEPCTHWCGSPAWTPQEVATLGVAYTATTRTLRPWHGQQTVLIDGASYQPFLAMGPDLGTENSPENTGLLVI